MTIETRATEEEVIYQKPHPEGEGKSIVLVRGGGSFATLTLDEEGLELEREDHGSNFLVAVQSWNGGAAPEPEPKPEPVPDKKRLKIHDEPEDEDVDEDWDEDEDEDDEDISGEIRGIAEDIKRVAKEADPELFIRLENHSGSHYKFWEVACWGSKQVRRWGRIGTRGQSKTEHYAGPTKAKQAARNLANKKLGSGYEQILWAD